MFPLLLSTVSIVHAAPETKGPRCAELPQRICDAFKARRGERFIDFPDGTFVTNPAYVPDPETTGSIAPPEPKAPTFRNAEILGELMDYFDVPDIKAARTKLQLGLLAAKIFDDAYEKVLLPWPLGAAKPQPQVIDREAVLMALKGTLGAARLEKLRRFVRKTETGIAMAAQSNQFARVSEGDRLVRERYAKLINDRAATEARSARVLELFRAAKANAIRVATGDRPRGEWTPDQVNMVTRIDAVEPRILTPTEAESNDHCRGLKVNATFDHGDHQMIICPASLWQPDLNLVGIFGHELGHPVDACAMQGDFAEFDHEKLRQAADDPKFSPVTRELLSRFLASGTRFVPDSFDMYVDAPAVRAELVKMGAIKVRARRFDKLPEPYRGVKKCVEERYNFRSLTPARRELFIADHAQNLEDLGGLSGSEQSVATARVRRYLEKKPDCPLPDTPTRTQRNEVMGDISGDLVRESYAHDHPPAPGDHTFNNVMGAFACRDQSIAYAGEDLSPGSTTVFLNQHRTRTDDEHPGSWKRVQLEADLPGLAKLFGCTRDEAGCFDALSIVKSAGAGSAGAGSTR